MDERKKRFLIPNIIWIVIFLFISFLNSLYLLSLGAISAFFIKFFAFLIGALSGYFAIISIRHLFHKKGYSYSCLWCYLKKSDRDFREQQKKEKKERKKEELENKIVKCPICKENIYAVDLPVHMRDRHKKRISNFNLK